MLAAEALRLAAIEVLCPTPTGQGVPTYPTLARHLVYDSRAAAVEDIDRKAPYTPVLSLYSPETGASLRGEAAAADDTVADAVLDVVAELAVVTRDDESGDDEFADAMAGSDAEARLVLAALCSQVRFMLERRQEGLIWRRIAKRIIRFEEKTWGVPELGLRWQRVIMRFHVEIPDDDFDMDDGGLPQPIRRLYEALPEQSYAKAKLEALASHFMAEILPPFEGGKASGPED